MNSHDTHAGYHDTNQQESKNDIINLQDGRGVLGLGAHHFRNGGRAINLAETISVMIGIK